MSYWTPDTNWFINLVVTLQTYFEELDLGQGIQE